MNAAAAFPVLSAPYARRDGYHLMHPETGKKHRCQRVTTFARTLAETWGITDWAKRNVARGMALRPDLVALAASTTDKYTLNDIVASAEERAGGTAAANYGQAMHEFTRIAEAGGDLVSAPPEALGDLDAYMACLDAHQLTSYAAEQVVYWSAGDVAGRFDRIMGWRGDAYIADIKTGADLSYSWAEIAVQLAAYALAEWLWDPMRGWVEKPPVDLDTGLVLWMPYGQGTCDLYTLNIDLAMTDAIPLIGGVKAWRKHGDDLAALVQPSDEGRDGPREAPSAPGEAPTSGPAPDDDPPPVQEDGGRAAWARDRVLAVGENERARRLISQGWPDGMPPKPPWTDEQVDALTNLLVDVEREVQAPFPPPDPAAPDRHLHAVEGPEGPPELFPQWDILDDGLQAEDQDVAALKAAVGRLPADRRRLLYGWVGDATRAGRAIDAAPMRQRQWLTARAAICCAKHVGDEALVIEGLTAIVGTWVDSWKVGAVIGCLSAEQAERLAVWAESMGQV